MRGGQWTGGRLVAIVVGLSLASSQGQASQLTLPTVGPSDAPLGGNVVALPQNVITALFHNPAHLSLLPNSATLGLLAIRFQPGYANDQGYDSTSRELPVAPSFGYVTDRWAPFHFGIGMYGALGFTFNHDADPAQGVPSNFFTELVSVSLAPALAYAPSHKLNLGVALNPTYGRLRFKTPSPAGRIDVDVRGPGVFGTLGLLYTPTPQLNLGVGYKTPGTIWMFGNARVDGQGDDAMVSFQIPQSVEFGAAYRATSRFTMVVQARWTEFSVFEETKLRFDERTFLNRTAVGDARDRFRIGGGVEYEFFPGIVGRVGFSWERWAIKANSLAPTLADNTDFLFPFGLGITWGLWQIDLAGGVTHTESREVSPEQNPFFSGRYTLNEPIFGIQVTRLLGGDATHNAAL